MSKRKTQEEVENQKIKFINKSNEIFNFKYDYSKVKYVNKSTNVMIYCPIHKKDFKKTPTIHLKGKGCPKCGQKNKTTEMFIEDARKVHGNKYDYSKTNYINKYTDVIIICSVHDDFIQTPDVHLSGSGCPKCKGLYKTNEEFIKEAREIHGNK